MEHQDSRLPDGITIWENAHNEFVAITSGEVVQIGDKNVRAGNTIDEAVSNYLDGVVMKGKW